MNDTSFWVIAGGIAVFFAATLIYVALLFFFPEWVGVTGKVALETEKSHRDDHEATSEVTSKNKGHI